MADDTLPPPPGSDAAVDLGCSCPILDNRRGRGIPSADGPLYWTTAGCPVHAPTPTPTPEDQP